MRRGCLHSAQTLASHPEEAISPAKLGPGRRSLVHGELLAQGEVLQGELAVPAAEERQESKTVEEECDHRAGILSGPEPTVQPLGRRTELWRRTGSAGYGATPSTP
jgi:hypothetical protein